MLTVALGVVIGLVLALTGAGGGVLSVPLLVLVLHLNLKQAGPVGLLAIALSAGIGASLGLREKVVRYRAAAVMASFGMASAPFGLWLAQGVANRPLAILFSLVLAGTSVRMLLQAKRERHAARHGLQAPGGNAPTCELDQVSGRLVWTLPCARAMAAAGTVSGFLSGLLGVGGGFVIVPALRMVTNLPMRSIVATSLAVVTLVSLVGVATATAMGSMPWGIGLPFALGAAAGLLGGRLIAKQLAGPQLQLIFALVGFLVAAMMLLRVH
jgi:uncharacterized membrane protein YfcA